MTCAFDEPPGLLFNAWHIWVRGVDQSGDLCGPNKAVLGQRPAQVQPWGSQVRLNRPVGVRRAIVLITSIEVR